MKFLHVGPSLSRVITIEVPPFSDIVYIEMLIDHEYTVEIVNLKQNKTVKLCVIHRC